MREFFQILAVHASHHIERNIVGMRRHVDGPQSTLKAMRVAAEMVVVVFESVKANRKRTEARIQKFRITFRS